MQPEKLPASAARTVTLVPIITTPNARCGSTTPRGREVLPELYRIAHGSAGPTGSGSGPSGSPAAGGAARAVASTARAQRSNPA
jgi:hypothetical protein